MTRTDLARWRWTESACALPLDSNNTFVFSSLYGVPLVLSGGGLLELTQDKQAKPIPGSRFLRLSGAVPTGLPVSVLDRLRASGLMVADGDATGDRYRLRVKRTAYLEEMKRKPSMNRLGLTLTSACNFGCSYCIRDSADRDRLASGDVSVVLGKGGDPRRPGSGAMTFATAQSAVDALHRVADPNAEVAIGFSGGEPLIRWKLIKEVVAYAEDLFGSTITFGLNTNAALVTDEIAAYLAAHPFVVSTSLDGQKGVNGRSRTFRKKGGDTYDVIVDGLQRMRAAGVTIVGLYATIVDANREALSVSFLDEVASLGVCQLTFEPDLVHSTELEPLWLAGRLADLVLAGRQRKMSIGGYWRRAYDEVMHDLRDSSVQTFCGASSGEGFNVTPDGAVQNCSFSASSLGRVDQFDSLVASSAFRDYVEANYAGFIPECEGCGIEGLCQGGCGLTRAAAKRPDRERVFRDHCLLYREVTARLIEASWQEQCLQPLHSSG